MSASDSEESGTPNTAPQTEFVKILQGFPVLLSKSQTPAVRKGKSEALVAMKKKWESCFGSEISVNQLLKKINNMKTRLKKKTDINRTGNKKIKLLDWEKVFLNMMNGDGDGNPVITKVPGCISAGTLNNESVESITFEGSFPKPNPDLMLVGTSDNPPVQNTERSKFPRKHKLNEIKKYETDATKNLSNTELQRLVLLKQLKVLELKEKKLKRELHVISSDESD